MRCVKMPPVHRRAQHISHNTEIINENVENKIWSDSWSYTYKDIWSNQNWWPTNCFIRHLSLIKQVLQGKWSPVSKHSNNWRDTAMNYNMLQYRNRRHICPQSFTSNSFQNPYWQDQSSGFHLIKSIHKMARNKNKESPFKCVLVVQPFADKNNLKHFPLTSVLSIPVNHYS